MKQDVQRNGRWPNVTR